jgi:hypothetical protein
VPEVLGGKVTVLAAHNWATNADLIADVAKLGYLDGHVYDCTFGKGAFWKKWRPENFLGTDLYAEGVGHIDFTKMPWPSATWFDAVVFDPPYKLNGTSRPEDAATDAPYGVAGPYVPAVERHRLMRDGLTECARVVKACGHVLVKCQAQVCSGRMHWQDLMMIDHGRTVGLELVDRFDLLGKHRPQPMEGRKQKHAHGRPSTLLVFRKVST